MMTTETFAPVPDEDFEVEFRVWVRCYGKPGSLVRSVEKAMCRVTHLAFGADSVRIESNGAVLLYDPAAHDGPHAESLDPPIVRVPVLDPPMCSLTAGVNMCGSRAVGMVDGEWFCQPHMDSRSGVERA